MSEAPVIAIVDDDEAVRDALLDLLLVEGMAGETFASAAAFLDAYTPGTFQGVITDVRMAGIDGLEMQRQLRARGADVPVIVLTSSTDEETRERALQGGAFGYVTKPVADEVLLTLLRNALVRAATPGDPPAEHPPRR